MTTRNHRHALQRAGGFLVVGSGPTTNNQGPGDGLRHFFDVEDLRDEDRAEYERLDKQSFSPGDLGLLVLSAVAYPVLLIFLAVMSERTKDSPDDLDSLFGFLSIVVLMAGWLPILAAWRRATRNAKKAHEERLWRFGRKTGAIPEFIGQHRGFGGGSSGSGSRRQMQHEWYGGHSELNYTDRVRGEMYGMDADTYISNVAEHDKD